MFEDLTLNTRDVIALVLLLAVTMALITGVLDGQDAMIVYLGIGTAYGLLSRRAEGKYRARVLELRKQYEIEMYRDL